MFRLYITKTYGVPGVWMTVESVPFSWQNLKKVWREFKAAARGEGYLWDFIFTLTDYTWGSKELCVDLD